LRQIASFFSFLLRKKGKNNLARGGGRRFTVLLDPPVVSTMTE
jgi:hypothetical protein